MKYDCEDDEHTEGFRRYLHRVNAEMGLIKLGIFQMELTNRKAIAEE